MNLLIIYSVYEAIMNFFKNMTQEKLSFWKENDAYKKTYSNNRPSSSHGRT